MVSTTQLLVILVIALVIFGPKRLPELGKTIGKSLKNFKDSMGGGSDDHDDHSSQSNQIEGQKPGVTPMREQKKTYEPDDQKKNGSNS
jgi:sec-independent protein translocase protein TatA